MPQFLTLAESQSHSVKTARSLDADRRRKVLFLPEVAGSHHRADSQAAVKLHLALEGLAPYGVSDEPEMETDLGWTDLKLIQSVIADLERLHQSTEDGL
jgi:hypothetical protein